MVNLNIMDPIQLKSLVALPVCKVTLTLIPRFPVRCRSLVNVVLLLYIIPLNYHLHTYLLGAHRNDYFQLV